jgi:hypothetical protein
MGKRADDKCELCRKAQRQVGITDEMSLQRETLGHLQSAYCKGQAKAVTKAHHNCFRELQHDVASNAGGKDEWSFVTLEQEETLRTSWLRHHLYNGGA